MGIPPKTSQQKISNLISVWKFIFLSIVTFGFYELYWFYRNWKYIGQKENRPTNPILRAMFAPITNYLLFKTYRDYAIKEGYSEKYSPGWKAFFWLLFRALATFSYFDPYYGSSSIFYGVTYYLISLLFLLKPLKCANFYYSKTEKNHHPRGWWRTLVIVLTLWLLVFISFIIGIIYSSSIS